MTCTTRMTRMMRMTLALGVAVAACGDDAGNSAPMPDASIVGVPGTYAIAGVARYEDRPQLASGLLGPPSPKVARGVAVAVVADADGATLAEGTADDTGHFALMFPATGGGAVHVLLATSSTLPARPISVERSPAMVFGFGGATFPAGEVTEQDVLVTVASKTAQAFNIFDELIDVMDVITGLGHATPTPLTAFWAAGSQDGTYYVDAQLHLLGDPSDDDGFDDTVILHEAGHYFEDQEGRSDSQGGNHDGSPTDPTLAWSEGFSTYFSMAVHDHPVYIDTNVGGGWSYNGDTSVTPAPQAAGTQSQLVSEDMITEILWDLGDDLGDGGVSDDDVVTGTHRAVLLVETAYLKTAALRDLVSVVGVDLVDWLDGWFVAAGLADCSGARGIVTTSRKFPYDFAGPAGACP